MLRSNRLRSEDNTDTLVIDDGVLLSTGIGHRISKSRGQ